jgi:hypothetical protein
MAEKGLRLIAQFWPQIKPNSTETWVGNRASLQPHDFALSTAATSHPTVLGTSRFSFISDVSRKACGCRNAVDLETLDILARLGIRYTILSHAKPRTTIEITRLEKRRWRTS